MVPASFSSSPRSSHRRSEAQPRWCYSQADGPGQSTEGAEAAPRDAGPYPQTEHQPLTDVRLVTHANSGLKCVWECRWTSAHNRQTWEQAAHKGNLHADRVKNIKPAFCSLNIASFCCLSIPFSCKLLLSVLAHYCATHGKNEKGCFVLFQTANSGSPMKRCLQNAC